MNSYFKMVGFEHTFSESSGWICGNDYWELVVVKHFWLFATITVPMQSWKVWKKFC